MYLVRLGLMFGHFDFWVFSVVLHPIVAVLAVDLSRLLALESPSPPSGEHDMLVEDECSAIVIQFAV